MGLIRDNVNYNSSSTSSEIITIPIVGEIVYTYTMSSIMYAVAIMLHPSESDMEIMKQGGKLTVISNNGVGANINQVNIFKNQIVSSSVIGDIDANDESIVSQPYSQVIFNNSEINFYDAIPPNTIAFMGVFFDRNAVNDMFGDFEEPSELSINDTHEIKKENEAQTLEINPSLNDELINQIILKMYFEPDEIISSINVPNINYKNDEPA